MIPGIVSTDITIPAMSNVPTDSFLYIDFTSQTYALEGVEVPLSTLLDRTDMAISASGARFDWNTADVPAQFKALPLSVINSNATAMTVVAEWVLLSNPEWTHLPIQLIGPGRTSDPYVEDYLISMDCGAGYIQAGGNLLDFDQYCYTSGLTFATNTIYRVAYRYAITGFCRAAWNGTDMVNQGDIEEPGATPTFGHAAIGGLADPVENYLYMNGYIRKIEFYTSKDDVALRALSTV